MPFVFIHKIFKFLPEENTRNLAQLYTRNSFLENTEFLKDFLAKKYGFPAKK